MGKKVVAQLQWTATAEGGRRALPTGPRFDAVGWFDQQTIEERLEGAWSLVVKFLGQPDAARSHRAEVSFLVEEAPSHLLSDGSTFKLMEGDRIVATGVVLSECDADE